MTTRGATLLLWTVTATWLVVCAAAEASPSGTQEASLPSGKSSEILRSRCLLCHGTDLIRQQRLTSDGWAREVEKMTAWGAPVAESEKGELVAYLAEHFGIQGASPDAGVADGGAGALLQARCVMCHDRRLIEAQRLTTDGWARELDKMIGWGATLTGPERARLIDYLAKRFPAPGSRRQGP